MGPRGKQKLPVLARTKPVIGSLCSPMKTQYVLSITEKGETRGRTSGDGINVMFLSGVASFFWPFGSI